MACTLCTLRSAAVAWPRALLATTGSPLASLLSSPAEALWAQHQSPSEEMSLWTALLEDVSVLLKSRSPGAFRRNNDKHCPQKLGPDFIPLRQTTNEMNCFIWRLDRSKAIRGGNSYQILCEREVGMWLELHERSSGCINCSGCLLTSPTGQTQRAAEGRGARGIDLKRLLKYSSLFQLPV